MRFESLFLRAVGLKNEKSYLRNLVLIEKVVYLHSE